MNQKKKKPVKKIMLVNILLDDSLAIINDADLIKATIDEVPMLKRMVAERGNEDSYALLVAMDDYMIYYQKTLHGLMDNIFFIHFSYDMNRNSFFFLDIHKEDIMKIQKAIRQKFKKPLAKVKFIEQPKGEPTTIN